MASRWRKCSPHLTLFRAKIPLSKFVFPKIVFKFALTSKVHKYFPLSVTNQRHSPRIIMAGVGLNKYLFRFPFFNVFSAKLTVEC